MFARRDNLPLIVHCSQGRDRTGIVVALLLRALGTDERAVTLDYAETDVRLEVILRLASGALAKTGLISAQLATRTAGVCTTELPGPAGYGACHRRQHTKRTFWTSKCSDA